MTVRDKHQALSRQARSTGDTKSPTQSAWLTIDNANRIFGFDGWSRQIIEMRCAATREIGATITTAYVAKICIELQIGDKTITRQGYGCGDGRGSTPFEAHDRGLKAAELDATARTLATFGKGLRPPRTASRTSKPVANVPKPHNPTSAERPFPGDDDEGRPPGVASQSPTAALVFADNDSAILLPKQIRRRDKSHLAHVRKQPCLICDRLPVDAHDLRFAQPTAMAKKVSDEFTVPLCRSHHAQLHKDPHERAWWRTHRIDPLDIASELWDESQGLMRV